MIRIRRPFVLILISLAASLSIAQQPAQVYTSNEGQNTITQLQFTSSTTGILTVLYNIGASPDDMVVNSQGQLIYTVPKAGTVNLYDPSTGINSVIASGIMEARDICIEPGGQTLLIAKYDGPGEVVRVNISTGQWTPLVGKSAKLQTIDGIAYDEYGNLYAVANHNTIIQINPTTGAIIATLVLEPHHNVNGGDGLTWDSYTQSLWTTHDGTTGIGLVQIFVQSSGFASTTSSGFTFYPTGKAASNLDGIKSDGNGNLYIGALWNVLVYNIPSNTVTYDVPKVRGADGIGLVPGTY